MHTPPLIRDLAVLLGTAGLVTFLFRLIRQPVVLGYVVAGIIVGPFTPPQALISDIPNIKIWSELGVIFLMFALGLEFTFHKLARVGVTAGGTAIFEVLFMGSLGLVCARVLGWTSMDGWFLGGILAISSTTIIIKALEGLGLKTRKFADVVFGVLIVEDLLAILILVALSTITAGGVSGWGLLFAALKLGFIVGTWVVVGYFFIPSFVRYAGKQMDDEALTVFSTGLCLILVAVATHYHYSAALGAFIMGSILAETQQAHRIEALIQPVKNLFAAVFFVSVGMLVDPAKVVEHWGAVLFLTVVTIGGKILSSTLGAMLSGESPKNAVQIGFSLAQIGEFSFIIAALGSALGATSDFLYPIAVAVSVVTTFTTPYLVKVSDRCGAWFEARLPGRLRELQRRYGEIMRAQPAPDVKARGIGRHLIRFLACGVAGSIVFILMARADFPPLAGWAGAVALSAPFVWGMYFAFRPGRGVIGLLPFLSRLVVIIWLGLMSALFFKTTLTILPMLAAAGTLFFAFYRHLEKSYRWLEKRFVSNLGAADHDPSSEVMQALAPWELHLVRVIVHPNSAFVARTLKELDVRHQYGLNIVVLQRGERFIAPPGAEERLLPGDVLLVLGTDEQIERFDAAARLPSAGEIEAKSLGEYRLKRIVVTEHSPYAGKAIRESGIRESLHAIVVGLERSGERLLNPHPTLSMQVGDVLWLVGESPR